MNVHDSGSSKAPQSDEQIIVIEETKKQLEDVIKTLNVEVKDSIVALWTEVSKLATTMKVILMAMRKTPILGDTSESKGKEKVLEPKLEVGKWNA